LVGHDVPRPRPRVRHAGLVALDQTVVGELFGKGDNGLDHLRIDKAVAGRINARGDRGTSGQFDLLVELVAVDALQFLAARLQLRVDHARRGLLHHGRAFHVELHELLHGAGRHVVLVGQFRGALGHALVPRHALGQLLRFELVAFR